MPVTLTDKLLQAVMPDSGGRVDTFLTPLQEAMDHYSVSDTPERVAMFLAQIGHESGDLKWVRELWGPTLAQKGYEGRTDLGNTQPGDGHRFLGRGLIQITGRGNYTAVSRALWGDDRLLDAPETLQEPGPACLSAAWFWDSRHLNVIADAGDFILCTKRINGGTNGLFQRQSAWIRAKAALGVE